MRRLLPIILFVATAWLSCACQEDLEAVSQVTKFRVMAVQADPPEVAIAEDVTLRVLYHDPEERPVTALWISFAGLFSPTGDFSDSLPVYAQVPSCAPGPQHEYPIPGALLSFLELPEDEPELEVTTMLVLCAGGQLPDVPADSCFDEDALMSAFEEIEFTNPEDLCVGGDGIVAFKTFLASDRAADDPLRNLNPILLGIHFDGVPLPFQTLEENILPGEEGDPGFYRCTSGDGCREAVELEAYLVPNTSQQMEQTQFGETEVVDERTYVSWFVTGGGFAADRSGTSEDSPAGPFENDWLPPREGGSYLMWAVAHDIRGGVSWQRYAVTALP